MFRTFANAWKIADIRKKLIFTGIIILIYRIGSALPVPFTNIAENGLFGNDTAGTFVTYLSMMTGNAFNYGTLFALSITPYINASIIIQLLTVAITFLEIFEALVVILCYTAGTVIVMWLGERINEKGIGNGISMILFAGIVARMPTTITSLYQYLNMGGAKGRYYILVPIAAIALIGMIFYIVWMDNAERRIPVQYAKRVVGRKMYGGQNTHMPIKVNMCGVLPIIFASSVLSILPTIAMFAPGKEGGA